MAGYTRRFVQRAHESAVQIEDVGSDGPGVDDLEHVEGNVEGVVDAVAWIDLLAQCFRSALAFKEGAESGVVLKNGGGEVQFDALGRRDRLR